MVLLAVFSTLTLAAAATVTIEQRERSSPDGAPPPRSLAAPLFTPRRLPAALGGLLSRADLEISLAGAALEPDGMEVCVQVRAVGSGEVLFTLNAERAIIPASTMKLLTGGAALEVLGPDYRFATRVLAEGAAVNGVVDGPLYLVGGGDPLIYTAGFTAFEDRVRPDYIPVAPRRDLSELAASIRGRGIVRVTGGIVGDASFFDDQTINPAWIQGYFDEKVIAPITGLAVNRNLVGYETAPDPYALGFAAEPAANAAEHLRQHLADAGVAVDGFASTGAAPAAAVEVSRLESAPLADVVELLEKASDNYVTENLLKTLGAERRGEGSFGAGAEVVVDLLTNRGVAVAGLVMADGSGLARSNQIPCTLLADLLSRTSSSPGLAEMAARLGVTGETGTLQVRYPDPELKGRVAGKTGGLDGVSNLAGLVPGTDGREGLAFAVLVNGEDWVEAREIHVRVMRELLGFPSVKVPPAGSDGQ